MAFPFRLFLAAVNLSIIATISSLVNDNLYCKDFASDISASKAKRLFSEAL